jgi:hypothetical protein
VTPHGPRTEAEVLAAAVAEMDAEAALQDAVEAWLAGRPTGLRRPRKTLRRVLHARRGDVT